MPDKQQLEGRRLKSQGNPGSPGNPIPADTIPATPWQHIVLKQQQQQQQQQQRG